MKKKKEKVIQVILITIILLPAIAYSVVEESKVNPVLVFMGQNVESVLILLLVAFAVSCCFIAVLRNSIRKKDKELEKKVEEISELYEQLNDSDKEQEYRIRMEALREEYKSQVEEANQWYEEKIQNIRREYENEEKEFIRQIAVVRHELEKLKQREKNVKARYFNLYKIYEKAKALYPDLDKKVRSTIIGETKVMNQNAALPVNRAIMEDIKKTSKQRKS